MSNDAALTFVQHFLEQAPSLVEFITAAYQDGVLDRNPSLSGNGEDVMNELIGEAEQVLKGEKA